MKIVADGDLPFVQEYFASAGDLVLKSGRLIEAADVVDADLLLVRSVTPVNEKLLRGSSVKWVATVTTGYDHLDTAWLDKAGIRWCTAEGYNALPVSDYVISVLAALQQQNHLPKDNLRAGIIGVGRIGGQVAQHLQNLGYQVLLCDPPRAELEPDFHSQDLSHFPDLDFVTLHTPLTREGRYPSYHLIDAAFLSANEKGAVLLNASRGAVVDFSAIKTVGDRWQACFDVWEQEPEIDRQVLESALIATPHLAGYSMQCRYRGIDLIYHTLCDLHVIKPTRKFMPQLPRNRLSFANQRLSWQQVVLAIFNPLQVTQVMKQTLKGRAKCATLFDELRKRYIGDQIKRHEFAYTSISQVKLAEKDRNALLQLGITIEE